MTIYPRWIREGFREWSTKNASGDGTKGRIRRMIRPYPAFVLNEETNYRLTEPMVSWYNTGMDKLTTILVALAIIAIMNTAAFVLMGHDKKCARQGKWRVPEKTLFLVTACFGGLGGVVWMKMFHHKTQHWYNKR